MTAVQIAKIAFLVVITVCAVISAGCGLVISKKKFKDNDAKRQRNMMRVRAICFIIMMVMLLLIVVIR